MTTVEHVPMWGHGLKIGDTVIPKDYSWGNGLAVVSEEATHGYVKLLTAKNGLSGICFAPEGWSFDVVQLRDEPEEKAEPEGFKIPDLTPAIGSDHSMLVSIVFNGDRDEQIYYYLDSEDGQFCYAKGFGIALDSMQDIIDMFTPGDDVTFVIHAGAKVMDTETIADEYEEFYRNHIWQDIAGDFYVYDKSRQLWIQTGNVVMSPNFFGDIHSEVEELQSTFYHAVRDPEDDELMIDTLTCISPNWEYIKP